MGKYVGQSVTRAGGRERVTGRLLYTADLAFPGECYARMVHLPCGRARIEAINTRAAARVRGVRLVLTPRDLPRPMPRFGPVDNDRPLLADGETKYEGEPVAVVVADDEEAAEEAAARVRVAYEPLPGVYTLKDALAPGAPLVQDPSLRPDSPHRHTNVYGRWTYGWGDAGRHDAHLVVEDTYRFPMLAHVAIEPHAYIAAPDEQGGVAIWSTVQHPFLLRQVVAACLGLAAAKVRVTAVDLGGGFGGKGYPKLEVLVAALALKVGRPVRLVLSMAESFSQARRASSEVHARIGFAPDGHIVFLRAEADYLVGAYADITARIVGKACYLGCGPYHVPDLRVTGRAVFSHTVPATAFRGFGSPQYLWALESLLDEGARRLGIDRVEVRRRNLPQPGQILVPGDTPVDGRWAEALQRTADALGWTKPLGPHRGRGVAIGIKSPRPGTVSQAIVRLHADSSATVLVGTVDMGQGSRTIMRQLAADELGIPPQTIQVHCADTALVPFDALTASSRSTVFMGNAVLDACAKVRGALRAMAAEEYGAAESAITVAGGAVRIGKRKAPYGRVIQDHYGPGAGEVIGVGECRQKVAPDHPLDGTAPFWELICFGAEVEVDEETGRYRIVRFVTTGDIGKALNPAQLRGQDEGGAVMGLGHTMMEHLVLDSGGRLVNRGLLDYRIPTSKDIPDKTLSLLVENSDGPGPYGAKGTGESGVLAVSPAVVSALSEATGLGFTDLPVTPERLWEALQEGRARPAPTARRTPGGTGEKDTRRKRYQVSFPP